MGNKYFVRAPLAGLRRELGYQSQPEFSTVESLNMLPFDAITGRKVAATRPPMAAFPTPGGTVNMIARVNGSANNEPQTGMVAAYAGDLYRWTGTAWTAVTMGGLEIDDDRAVFSVTFLKKVFILQADSAPLVYDYGDDSLVLAVADTGKGTFPDECRVGAAWQGGIWLAGAPDEPHVFSGSRTGNAFDWDFSAAITDTSGAFTATGEAFGLISDPITALIPLSGDVLVIACENSMWALRGHPRRGGTLEQISSTVGVLGQGAWAKGPDGKMFFLSHAGLCVMDASGTAAAPLSRKSIPDELFLDDYDYYDPKACIAYDPRFNGLHITVRGDEEQAWWFDLDTGGFHQQSYIGYPYAMIHYPPVEAEGQSGVLFAGDGYGGIARFDTTETETMAYRVLVGPVQLSPNISERGLIQTAQHIIGGGTTEDNDLLNINIWIGGSAEDVYNRYRIGDLSCKHEFKISDMIPNGCRVQPRAADSALLIEVSGISTDDDPTRIVYEGTEIEVVPAGRARRLIGRVDGAFDPSATFIAGNWSADSIFLPPPSSGQPDLPSRWTSPGFYSGGGDSNSDNYLLYAVADIPPIEEA